MGILGMLGEGGQRKGFFRKVISSRTQAKKTVLPVLLVLSVPQPVLCLCAIPVRIIFFYGLTKRKKLLYFPQYVFGVPILKLGLAEITPIEPEPDNAGVGNHRCSD